MKKNNPIMLLFMQLGKAIQMFGVKRRQITASILTFCMVLTMLPLGFITASAGTTATETADFTTNATKAIQLLGSGASWDSSSNTLTLTNVSFTTSADSGILLPPNSAIILNGTNTIKVTGKTQGIAIYTAGVTMAKNITFKGDGTLALDASVASMGIYVWNGIFFTENVSVTMCALQFAAIANNGGIYVRDNAKVYAYGGSSGLTDIWDISRNATVVAYGTSYAVGYVNPYNTHNYRPSASVGQNKDGTGTTTVSEISSLPSSSLITYKYLRIDPNPCSHNWGAWTNNGNGTHSRTCGICAETQTENHTASSAFTYDALNHWHVCSACGVVVGNKESHTFVWDTVTHEYKCSVCGYVSKTDATAPTVSGVENGNNYYTDTTFTVTDNNLSTVTLDSKPITLNQGKYTVPVDDQQHTLTASDLAGNTTTVTFGVYHTYQVTLPVNTVGYAVSSSDSKTVAYNGSFHFTVALADGYSKTESFAVKANGTPITANSDGTYTIKTITANQTITVEGVSDVTAPTTKISIGANNWNSFLNRISFGLFFKETQTVNVTASDNGSGLNKVEYIISDTSFASAEAIIGLWQPLSLSDGKASFNTILGGKQYIYIRATDKDGNKTVINSEGVVVYTDSTLISDSVSYVKTSNTDSIISINSKGNTIKEIKIGDTVLIKDDFAMDNADTIRLKAGCLEKLANANYTVTISYNPLGETYTQRDGNEAPTATTISLTVDNFDGKDKYTVNSNDWQNDNFIISAKSGFKVSLTDAADGEWKDTLTCSDETTSGSVTFYVRDTANSAISKAATETYKIDKTAPTGDITMNENSVKKFINQISFGLFFSKNVDVKITADDNASGAETIQYYRSETVLDENAVNAIAEWKIYNGTISETAKDTEKFIYYVRITDKAGNEYKFGSDGSTFDTTAPVISGIESNATYYTTQKVTVTDTNLDTITLNEQVVSSPFTISGNQDASYSIVFRDKAGNESQINIFTKPIASLSAAIDNLTESNVTSNNKSDIEAVKNTISLINIENATQAEKDKLKAISDKCDSLLKKITDTTAEIKRVTDAVNGYKPENVKSSDKDALVQLINDIDKVINTGNVAKGEIDALNALKNNATQLLDKIADVANAIADVNTKTNSITADTAKSSDKSNLDSTLATINDLLQNKSGNLTDNEKATLEQKKIDVSNALSKISDVKNAISDVTTKTNSITADTAKSSDKSNLDSALATINDLLQNKSGNLTDSEKAALEQKKIDVSNALSKISDVANAISDVTTKTNSITADIAKSSDNANLDSALATINDLLTNKSGNLTDSEKATLELKKADVQNALSKISDVTNAITDVTNKTKDMTKDNVKKDDLTNLQKTADELKKILDDYKNNLTDDEKNNISDKIKNIQDITGSLDQVKTVETQISKLPDADTVTKADADAINDANKAFDELSDHQKTLVDSGAVTKLNDVIKALSKLLLEDPATGTKVEGVDGTTFDVKTELVVTPIKDTLDASTKQLFAVGVANAANGQEIAQLFDIHLLLDGQRIQPDGKVKITLKLAEEMKNYTDLKVTYIADDGKVTIIPHEQNGDEITFYTDHFSNYGIIGTPVNSNSTGNTTAPSTTNSANTGETTPFIPYAIAGAASLFLVIAAKKKRSIKVVMK